MVARWDFLWATDATSLGGIVFRIKNKTKWQFLVNQWSFFFSRSCQMWRLSIRETCWQDIGCSFFRKSNFPLCATDFGSVLYKQSFADVCSSLILERRLAELTSYFGQTLSVTNSIERSQSWIRDRHVHKSSTRRTDSVLVLWRLWC